MTSSAGATPSVRRGGPNPYMPPRLARQDMLAGNRLAVSRRPWSADTGLGRIDIVPVHPLSIPRQGTPMVGLRALVMGDELTIWIPPGAISAIVQKVEPKANLGELSPVSRALVFEYVLADLLDRLETKMVSLSFNEITDPVREVSGDIGLRIKFADLPVFSALVACPPDALDRVRSWASSLPYLPLPMPDLPVTVALRAGVTWLPYERLPELREGDAVIFDATWLDKRRIAAVIGEKQVRVCDIQERGIVLSRMPPLKDYEEQQIWLMENDMAETRSSGQEPELGSVDGLEVKLVFEVGRLAVTVGDMERLDAGYVFDLGKDTGEAVDIYALNRLVGKGELVMVQDQLGVRITRMYR